MFDLNYFDMVRTFVWLMTQPTENKTINCNKRKAKEYAKLLYADKYDKIANMSNELKKYIVEIYNLTHYDIIPAYIDKFY